MEVIEEPEVRQALTYDNRIEAEREAVTSFLEDIYTRLSNLPPEEIGKTAALPPIVESNRILRDKPPPSPAKRMQDPDKTNFSASFHDTPS